MERRSASVHRRRTAPGHRSSGENQQDRQRERRLEPSPPALAAFEARHQGAGVGRASFRFRVQGPPESGGPGAGHALQHAALQGPLTAHHLAGNKSQCVDVRTGGHLGPASLLGCHVRRASHDRSGLGADPAGIGFPSTDEPGDPQIRDHRTELVLGTDEHHVPGLEVPVHEPPGVDRGEPLRHLLQQRQGVTRGERTSGAKALGQRLTVQKLHGDEGDRLPLGSWTLVEVEDPADVGMGDPPGELYLAPEALEQALDARRRCADRLQRDRGVQSQVPRLVDLPHSPTPDEADELEPVQEKLALVQRRDRLCNLPAREGIAQAFGLVFRVVHRDADVISRRAMRGSPVERISAGASVEPSGGVVVKGWTDGRPAACRGLGVDP